MISFCRDQKALANQLKHIHDQLGEKLHGSTPLTVVHRSFPESLKGDAILWDRFMQKAFANQLKHIHDQLGQ